MIIVVGHKAPDTDSACSAIVYSQIIGAKARVMNPVNRETEFALKKFGVKKPKVWNGEGDEFVLIDHNEASQSIGNYEKVVEIFDHHHKVEINLNQPIKVTIEPLGSVCTMIAQKYFDKLSKKQAGLLLSAILSDTVIFKSPTTTPVDVEIAEKLATIVGVDAKEYGAELKKAGMSLEGMIPKQIVMKDYKEYTLKGKKFFIGQVEVADLKEALKLKNSLLKEMKRMKYDTVLLMITDIINEVTELLVVGDEAGVGRTFGKKVVNNSITLPKVLSRKKQVVPPLTKHYS
jgi:manganese-dependent inorganic pyrophosphatase